MTNKDKILHILKEKGQVSNFEAIDRRITTRLSDVIFKLRNHGYKIECYPSEFNPKNFIYHLIAEPKAEQKRLL